MSGRFRSSLVGICLLLFSSSALPHDGDPKLRSPSEPNQRAGYRNAWIANPGGASGSIEMGGGGFPANGVTLLAWLPLSDFGNSQGGNSCWGYTSPSGREYAIFGHWDGTSFVEITNPANPVIVATIPTANGGSGNLWRDMKVYGTWCYAVTENAGGIQVISMANIDNGVVTLVNTIHGPGTDNTHTVALDEVSGFLYRSGGDNNGLRIYSLANPSNPTWVASWSTKYVHECQAVTYTSGPYAGKQVVFAFTGFDGGWTQPGIDIIDVTNKQSLQVLDSFQYPNAAYSHQGWLTPDKQYFYIGDELDEQTFGFGTRTQVYNVSNLSNAVYVGFFTNGTAAVGHNMYTQGNFLYQANYRSGLRVFDISNPASPSEVAYFDTYAPNDNAEFNGLWSCYPYFASGIVIGSDRESGLFVLWPGDPQLTFSFPQGLPDFVDPNGETLPVTITPSSPGLYVSGSATLHMDSGSGWVSIPMAELGGTSFEANFLPTPCGSHISFYFTAQSTSGITWADPSDAPLSVHEATSGEGVVPVAADDMEIDSGWTVGAPGDNATTGIWVRVNPNGTSAQPEDDHTPVPGTMCWVTGQGAPGGGSGDNDIDGGHTTLTTPTYDLSGNSEPIASYWRWYNNGNSSSDFFTVAISNNGGASWVNVETVGPAGAEADGGWFQHQFLVSDFVPPTANVRLRFVAADEGSGTVIEAAVDDLAIEDVECSACGPASYCQSAPNSAGPGCTIGSSGVPSVTQNAFVLEAYGAVPNQNGIFYYGPNQIEVPFGNGFRCVGGGTFRLNPPQQIDAFGDVVRPLDLTLPPADAGAGMIQAGDTWNFQFWYRDPAAGGSAFNFSDGLSVVFCP